MEKQYSLIIFDWDGTLVDSIANIVTALGLAAKDVNLPLLDEEEYKSIIGLSLANIAQRLYPGIGSDAAEAYIDAYRVHHHQLELSPSRPYHGVVDGLDWMTGLGLKLAVATGKRRHGLDRSMKANDFGHYFSASRCADESLSKPNPLMLEQLLSELQVPVEKALMVGDSSFDMEMAVNIGMDRAAVTYGAQGEESLLAHDPTVVAGSFSELSNWLEGRLIH